MKKNWIYKKLGEVCQSELGKTLNSKTDKGELSPYLCAINILWDKVDLTTVKYTKFEKSELERYSVKKGDLLVCEGGDIGRAAIWDKEETIQYQNALHRIRFNGEVVPRFCLLYLQHLKSTGVLDNNYGKGVTIKHLVKSSLLSIPIPVPSLETQKHIVSELDLLHSIIDKQKVQLKELDNLAQAVFYDMFGDPVENEKGWDVKPFSTMCSSMTKGPFGSDIKKELFVPKSDDTYKVYIQINAIQKDETLGDYYITKEYFENKMSRFEVKPNDYIITCDGTLGKHIRLTESMERGIISASLLRLRLNDSVSHCYFEALWDNYVLDRMKNQTRNAALIHLPSAKVIGNEPVPIPPLHVQQSFATKIESIEKQKSAIGKSIEETQKLFDYTMDKYFG